MTIRYRFLVSCKTRLNMFSLQKLFSNCKTIKIIFKFTQYYLSIIELMCTEQWTLTNWLLSIKNFSICRKCIQNNDDRQQLSFVLTGVCRSIQIMDSYKGKNQLCFVIATFNILNFCNNRHMIFHTSFSSSVFDIFWCSVHFNMVNYH